MKAILALLLIFSTCNTFLVMQKVNDMDACVNSLKTVLNDLKEVVQHHEQSDLQKYLGDMMGAVSACKDVIPHDQIESMIQQHLGDLPSCLNEVMVIVNDVKEFMSTKDLTKLPKYLQDVQSMVNECKSLVPHQNLMITNFQSVDPTQCFSHLPTLVADVQELVTKKDLSQLPKYVSDVMSAWNDCKALFPHANTQPKRRFITHQFQSVDPTQCFSHLPTLVADVKEVMAGFDASKLPKYLSDVMSAWNDCKALVPHHEVLVLHLQSVDPKQCFSHLPTLLADVKEVMAGFDASKLPKYLSDVMATWNDCKALIPHKHLMLMNLQAAAAPVGSLEKCLPHVPVLVADVQEVMKGFDVSKLPKYIQDVTDTYNDCKDLLPHQFAAVEGINDIIKCVQDLEPLVNDIKSAIQNKDLSKVIQILQEAYTAFNDCKNAIPKF